MTHHPVIQTRLDKDRTKRRWSPRLGYAMAMGGSGLVWSAVAITILALT